VVLPCVSGRGHSAERRSQLTRFILLRRCDNAPRVSVLLDSPSAAAVLISAIPLALSRHECSRSAQNRGIATHSGVSFTQHKRKEPGHYGEAQQCGCAG
jgi:hypothetical protein